MSPEQAFRTILKTQLDTAIAGTTHGSYPRHNEALPYVAYGETDLEDHPIGHTLRVMVHVQSKLNGPHECNTIVANIRDAMHGNSFSGNGWAFSCVREVTQDVTFDPNDEVWHAIMRLEMIASEV